MPKWEPTIHGSSDTILMHTPSAGRRRKRRGPSPAPMGMHTAPHKFAIGFGNKNQGLWVRETDGSYTHKGWTFDEALKAGYSQDDIFVVGRVGYYLTLAEARQAIPDGAHGVSYVDDFNDEWQDFYICAADGIDPEPYKEAHSPEPIQ